MSSCKILLMKQLLVRGDEQVVVSLFGSVEQVPLAKVGLTHLEGRVHGVLDQMTSGDQGCLGRTRPSRIHRIRQRFSFVGEDGFYVRTVDPWEPIEKLGHRGAVLEVLEQGGHRHSRPAEHPSPAELIRIPFNRRALILVCHSGTSFAWLSAQPRRGPCSILNCRRYRLLGDVSL